MWGSAAALAPLIAGCQPEPSPTSVQQTVGVVVVQPIRLEQSVTLTGTIASRTENNVSFRTSGQIEERFADVGDHVRKGQVLARLDARTQMADVKSATAGVAAADAQVRQAAAAFARAQNLLERGFTTRRDFDQADQALKVATANAESARAQLRSTTEALSFTELRADADGIVTDRQLEVGETAQAAATVFTIAWDGPRVALFDIYEGLLLQGREPPEVAVSLVSDPSVTTKGRIRQVAPSVDARTATVRVKVGLDAIPEAMTLGAAVSGTGTLPSPPVVQLPPAALTSEQGHAAVWVLNPQAQTVTMRKIHVSAFSSDAVVVDGGLDAGDHVVVEGTKLLRPGQKVVATEAASR